MSVSQLTSGSKPPNKVLRQAGNWFDWNVHYQRLPAGRDKEGILRKLWLKWHVVILVC